MAGSEKPGEAGNPSPDGTGRPDGGDLERRSRELDKALASKMPAAGNQDGRDRPATDGLTGFGQALRLSSEFIAGIVVGAGLGWLIDRVAGTSPWALIVFLLLGFAAGVLNVLRSAGLVAEPKVGISRSDKERQDGK